MCLNELKTFGYSVSGGVDVDNNQFNGMLILVKQKFLTVAILLYKLFCSHIQVVLQPQLQNSRRTGGE